MITKISQRDPRWSSAKIGPSNTTIGKDGCFLSSACMCLEKLRGSFCNPRNAAYYWDFDNRGMFNYRTTKFDGMAFVWRGWGYDSEKVKEAASGANTACVMAVNNNKHFVYVDRVHGKKLRDVAIIDPWDGKYYETLPLKYTPCGYCTFEKTEPFVPEWQKEVWEKAKTLGISESDPLTTKTIKQMQEIWVEMGIIEKADSKPTLGWWLAVMEKIKENW